MLLVQTHWTVTPPPNAIKTRTLWVALEHYLGQKKVSGVLPEPLRLEAAGTPLALEDATGFIHKAKDINLLWKNFPLGKTLHFERQISGPFASFESAERVALLLRESGVGAFVARPKDWEVWFRKDVNPPSGVRSILSKEIFTEVTLPVLVSPSIDRPLIGPLIIRASEGMKWNGGIYKGPFRIQRDAYGTWTLIEQVNMDNYLAGVVPHEIGSRAPSAALAAQSVLARTWALANSHRFVVDGFHLCSSTQCQVYKDPSQADSVVKQAIAKTSGKVLSWQGKPINAFYHATNGGVMASAQEAWAMEPLPYFRSRLDGPDFWAKSFSLPFREKGSLKRFLEKSDFAFGNSHKRFRWSRTLTYEDLYQALILDFPDIGKPISLKVLERGNSGRVTAMQIGFGGNHGPIVLTLDKIRRYLPQLPSTLFVLERLRPGRWLFTGGGFGHGVGLSQAGAIDLARRSWSTEEILDHYYPGTTYGILRDFKNSL